MRLKKEIDELCEKYREKPRYNINQEDEMGWGSHIEIFL